MPHDDTARPDAKLARGEASALRRRQRQALALRENLARRKAQARQRKAGEQAADSGAAADIARN